jgi:hypothetical protein
MAVIYHRHFFYPAVPLSDVYYGTVFSGDEQKNELWENSRICQEKMEWNS